MPPPLRLSRLLRGTPRHRGPRSLADLPDRRLRGLPSLRRLLGRRGDHLHHRHRCGAAARRDAGAGRTRGPAATRDRPRGQCRGVPPLGGPGRLRQRAAVGASPARRRPGGDRRHRRTRPAGPARLSAAAGHRPPARGRVHRGRGRRARLLHHLVPLARRGAGRAQPRRPDRPHHRDCRPVGGAVPGRRPPPRGRGPLARHAAAAHPRADRGHRRRADHVAARGLRRRAQLGLPLLLAA